MHWKTQNQSFEELSIKWLYEELSVVKINKTFTGYAVTCKVGLIDRKDPLSQLEASK